VTSQSSRRKLDFRFERVKTISQSASSELDARRFRYPERALVIASSLETVGRDGTFASAGRPFRGRPHGPFHLKLLVIRFARLACLTKSQVWRQGVAGRIDIYRISTGRDNGSLFGLLLVLEPRPGHSSI
jgi:hypothetical protein